MPDTKMNPPDDSSNLNRMAVGYFALQSLLGLAWWIGISQSEWLAAKFFPAASVTQNLKTFALADLTWFVALSAAVAFAIGTRPTIAKPLLWCLVGAIGYAFFVCLGLLWVGGPWLSATLMCGSWIITSYFAFRLCPLRSLVSPRQ